jgi:hypothetical protein
LPIHRDRNPVLGSDEVVVAVIADINLYPVDLTIELVAVAPSSGYAGDISMWLTLALPEPRTRSGWDRVARG